MINKKFILENYCSFFLLTTVTFFSSPINADTLSNLAKKSKDATPTPIVMKKKIRNKKIAKLEDFIICLYHYHKISIKSKNYENGNGDTFFLEWNNYHELYANIFEFIVL